MSIKKQFLKTKNVYRITWTLDKNAAGPAKTVHLVSDFSDWQKDQAVFKQLKNGTFKYVAEWPKGKQYQFRYLIDGTRWINEKEADSFVDNHISGEQNCVIAL